MGATESTSRSNGTEEEEEHQQENNRRSGGSSMGAGALATAAVGVGVVAAIGISRMLSNNTNTLERVPEGANSTWSHPPQGRYKMNTDGNTLERVPEGANSTRSHRPQSRYKMNTDGGCSLINGDHGPGGYGGLLRDPHGNWVKGFRGYESDTYTLTSELLSIQKGLELLDELNLKGAILENDNEQACEFVNGVGEYRGKSIIVRKSWRIIINCRELANRNRIEINHIQREYNQHAHKLAKMAIAKKVKYEEILELPNELMVI